MQGRSEAAIAHLEKAMRLDPEHQLDMTWSDGMTWAHFAAGRCDEALDWARRSVRIGLRLAGLPE